jgi:glucose-1-phosphate cytidylyltransferase
VGEEARPMKVVLFCGGLGTRIRELSGGLPKPLVAIGNRPILWHIMKYYAHYGHKDFILCLGYRGEEIKKYFLNYDPLLASDFTMSDGTRLLREDDNDISEWNITFVDTGLRSNIGQRLKAVQPYLEGEEIFLANYSDALSDLVLPEMIHFFKESGKIGCFMCVKPSQSFHVVTLKNGYLVEKIQYVRDTALTINGGCFIFRKDIFDYIHEDEDLVAEPFGRLIRNNQLVGYLYDKFWHCMDTFKEHQELNDMYEEGRAPWVVWGKKK